MFGAYAALVLLLFHCLPEFAQGHRSSRMDGVAAAADRGKAGPQEHQDRHVSPPVLVL